MRLTIPAVPPYSSMTTVRWAFWLRIKAMSLLIDVVFGTVKTGRRMLWTGNGSSIPCAVRASTISALRPSSRNVVTLLLNLYVASEADPRHLRTGNR